jgi:hypothetical protein
MAGRREADIRKLAALAAGAVLAAGVAAPAYGDVVLPEPPAMPAMQQFGHADPGCGWAEYRHTEDSDGHRESRYAFSVRRGCGPETYHHEVAHLLDWQVWTDWTRGRLVELLRLGSWQGSGKRGAPGYEYAADAYALCAMHATSADWPRRRFWGAWDWDRRGRVTKVWSGPYNYRESWSTHRAVCMTLWDASGLEWRVSRPRVPGLWQPVAPDPAPGA